MVSLTESVDFENWGFSSSNFRWHHEHLYPDPLKFAVVIRERRILRQYIYYAVSSLI